MNPSLNCAAASPFSAALWSSSEALGSPWLLVVSCLGSGLVRSRTTWLVARQPTGRAAAARAALIPTDKSPRFGNDLAGAGLGAGDLAMSRLIMSCCRNSLDSTEVSLTVLIVCDGRYSGLSLAHSSLLVGFRTMR